jgi:hypothetical protein
VTPQPSGITGSYTSTHCQGSAALLHPCANHWAALRGFRRGEGTDSPEQLDGPPVTTSSWIEPKCLTSRGTLAETSRALFTQLRPWPPAKSTTGSFAPITMINGINLRIVPLNSKNPESRLTTAWATTSELVSSQVSGTPFCCRCVTHLNWLNS